MTPTPFFEDEQATIYCGDAVEVMRSLTEVDMVFTSPPYNLGTSTGGGYGPGSLSRKLKDGYATYGDDMSADAYNTWQTKVVSAAWDTLSDTGAVFYNHKPRVQDGVAKLPTDYGSDLPLRQIVIWARERGFNFSQSFFLPSHEWICVWAKPDFRLSSKNAASAGDVWTIRPETDVKHPAPFPIGLPTTAIKATDATVILDPFMGSGTTLRAAKDLGRKAIGIEISEEYCQMAVDRLAQGVLF